MAVPTSSLRELYDWWAAEQQEFFTSGGWRSNRWRALIVPDKNRWHCRVRGAGDVTRVFTFNEAASSDAARAKAAVARSKPSTVVLRLEPSSVVTKTLTLPYGERRDTEAMIRNQIEFLAPWPPDKVLFDFVTADAADDGSPMAPVQVTMAGRDAVTGAMAQLRAAGLEVGVVDAGTDLEAEPRINLIASLLSVDRPPGAIVKRAMLGLFALAMAATLLGAWQAFATWRELAAVEARIESVSGAAAEAQRLIQAAEKARARAAQLAKRKEGEPPAVLAIEALSRVLPKDTYLVGFELRGREVRISGKSPAAADLISLLEGTKHFTKVRFAAPTTREQGQDIDSFSIVAELGNLMELRR